MKRVNANFLKSLICSLLAVVALALTLQQWHAESTEPPNDFGFFWTTAQFMKIYNRTDVYTEAGEQAINTAQPQPSGAFYTVTQTPFLYGFVSAISSGNFDTDGRRFHAISLGSFILATALLCWLFGYRSDWGVAAYIALLYLFAPLTMDAQVASNNRIQLGLLVLSAACLRFGSPAGHFGAGLLLGLGVMFKPTTLFAPLFLFASRALLRQWRQLALEAAGCLAGILAGFAGGALCFGSGSCWFDWASRMGRLPLDSSPLELMNFSLPVLLKSVTGANLSLPVLLVVFCAAAWRLFRLVRLRQKGAGAPGAGDPEGSLLFEVQMVTAGCLVYLLCAGLVWNHYYTFTVPVILLLLSPAWRAARGWLPAAAALLAAAALAAHILVAGAGMLLLAGFLCWGGSAALFWLATARPYPGLSAEKQ